MEDNKQGSVSGQENKRENGIKADDWHSNQAMQKFEKQQSGVSRWWLRIKLYLKRFIWHSVVKSTLFIKRLLDILASLIAIVLLSPIFIFTWLAIKVEDPGPAIFTQNRVGRWGKTFTMFKFRSMVMNADKMKAELMDQNESEAGVIFKMKEDPRITKVGKWIRKFSVDELPQLFNVLRGDMSLVGPRPPTPNEVEQYSLSDRRRLDVVPGITCIWQVSGRSDIDFEGQVRLDVQYIQSQSVWTDLVILLKTIPAVLMGKGAY